MQAYLITGILCAAVSQAAPVFEVASIKASAPPTDGRIMVRMNSDAGRIDYTNVSLRDLIKQAFKIKDHQLSGPDWLSAQRFDVSAKFPAGATKDDVPAMLQTLITERFKLTFHKDSKVMPVYALLRMKGDQKLKPADSAGGIRAMMGPKGRHLTGNVTLSQLADSLSNMVDRPVLDSTGLKGPFNIDLEFTSEYSPEMRMGLPGPGGPPPNEGGPRAPGPHEENADAPSLFTALQEKLGLKLEPQKAPIDIYMIDHVEKVPTEN